MNPELIETIAQSPVGWAGFLVGAGYTAKLIAGTVKVVQNGHSTNGKYRSLADCESQHREVRQELGKVHDRVTDLGQSVAVVAGDIRWIREQFLHILQQGGENA
jgi:hypothetical protein